MDLAHALAVFVESCPQLADDETVSLVTWEGETMVLNARMKLTMGDFREFVKQHGEAHQMASSSFLPDMHILQILDVWSELEQAYHGANSYGGDTAEIYAYRMVTANRFFTVGPGNTPIRDDLAYGRATAANLHAILTLFARQRHADVMINVGREHDGEPLSNDLLAQPFTHRIHVRVRPKPRTS